MILRILTAFVLIPLVLTAVLFLPSYVFAILIDLLFILALLEFFQIVGVWGVARYWPTVILGLGLPWVWIYAESWLTAYLVLACFAIMAWAVFVTRDMKQGFTSASGNLMALFYIGLPLAILARMQNGAATEVLLVLVAIWVADSAAYFTGKAWGRHKITPLISPNKSLEGYIAGLVGAAGAVWIFAHFLLPHWSGQVALLIGLALGFFSTLGDLFESVLKRGAGVKDSSNLIPGHGGVLDRIDSLLFAYPTYYLLSLSLLGGLA